MSEKKKEQLGMNPSTASGRLLKDILYKLVVDLEQDNCFHCNQKLTRETFSIEHKIPWLDSENPIELFFDLNNIAFSHLSCNIAACRKPHKKYFTEEDKYQALKDRNARAQRKYMTKEKRKEKYIRTGY